MKSVVHNMPRSVEFCLIILVCFGLTILATVLQIASHFRGSSAAPPPAIELKNDGILFGVMVQLLTLAIVLWIGRIRGWSLKTFGSQISWKWTGVGVLLFLAFQLAVRLISLITSAVFHDTLNFHRVSHLSLPFVILISIVNPVCEETIESGYLFQFLQQRGMWFTILVAAGFRGFLHASMGTSGLVTMFVMGVLYGLVYWRWRQLWPLVLAHSLQMFSALLPAALHA